MDIYEKNKSKHIAALIGWIIIMVAYLVQFFHIYRVYVLVVAILYLVYKNILKNEYPAFSLLESLSRYIGVTTFTFLGYFVVGLYPYTIVTSGNDTTITVLIENFFNRIIGIFSDGNLWILLALAIVEIMSIRKKNTKDQAWITILYQYTSHTTMYFFISYVLTQRIEIGLLFVGITIINIFSDLLEYKNFGRIRANANQWFLWFGRVFLIVLILEPKMMHLLNTNGYMDYYFFSKGFSTANIVLLSIVTLAVAAICYYLEKEEKQILADWFILALAELVFLVIYFVTSYYVGHWWLILIGYTIAFIGYINIMNEEDVVQVQRGAFLFISIIAIFFTVMIHNGKLISWGAFLIGAIIFANSLSKWAESKCEQNRVLIFALAGIAIFTFGRVMESRNIASNYIILIAMTVIFGLIVFLITYDPGAFISRKNRSIKVGAIAVGLFAILCFGISIKGGSNIKLNNNTETNDIDIEISARGKENKISQVEAYWIDDYAKNIIFKNAENLPEEKPVKIAFEHSKLRINRSGKLKIVVTDKYGMKTTVSHWYHVCEYQELKNNK